MCRIAPRDCQYAAVCDRGGYVRFSLPFATPDFELVSSCVGSALETTHISLEVMVGTRSRAPVTDVAGGKGDDEVVEEAAAAAAGAAEAGASSASGGVQPRRTRTRFSLPTPAAADDGRDGDGSRNSPSAAVSSRSRSSRSSSGQRSPSARTSLERLPQPPGGSPETPPRRSGRSTAGMRSQSLPEKQERVTAEGQGRSSGTRTSAELNALLGLDAAVRTPVCVSCVCFFSNSKFGFGNQRPVVACLGF